MEKLTAFVWYLLVLLCVDCQEASEVLISTPPPVPQDGSQDTIFTIEQILTKLSTDYERLPETQLAVSPDSTVFAQYILPTSRYRHGILGDAVEGGGVVVVVNGLFYELQLEEQYVFEDLRPRLADIDQDGALEFITIRSRSDAGAGIVIYKVIDQELTEYAFVAEIGNSNRWLNPAAIDDLDQDGVMEIAWVQTPHIGGILKVARFKAGEIVPYTETSQYSNHSIGERNLCLSVLTERAGQRVLYVPNQSRSQIIGFTLQNNSWVAVDTIEQRVDFSRPLREQYDFQGQIVDEVNCVY